MSVLRSKHTRTFGIRVAQIGSKNGSSILMKNQSLGNWFLVAVICQVSFADIVRKLALSGANSVPLGCPVRSRPSSLSLRQRSLVFNRISYPLLPSNDRLVSRSNSSSFSLKNVVVNLRWDGRGFAGHSQFQNYSNSSNDRFEGPNSRSSLRDSCTHPWASWKLIWRPKKILEQCPGNFGQDIVPSINAPSGPAVKDYRNIWGHSISSNNLQIFGISGQNCRRSFDSFPSKFENASWVYSPRLWFRSPLLSLTGGLSPHPLIIILVSSRRRFFREVALHLPRNLHCSQNPLPLCCCGRAHRLQALC
jgi:hypothetical protein